MPRELGLSVAVAALFLAAGDLPMSADCTGPDIVARVGAACVTSRELAVKSASKTAKIEAQLYQARRTVLDSMIDDLVLELESKRSGVTAFDLLRADIDEHVSHLSEPECKIAYEAITRKRPEDSPVGNVKATCDAVYVARVESEKHRYAVSLRTQYPVSVLTEPPRVASPVAPQTAGSAVSLVVFSDYQCPFCAGLEPTLEELERRYSGAVAIEVRNFPLAGHPFAERAAEASVCARDQDRFWQFHKALMAKAPRVSDAVLDEVSATAKLDALAFSACLGSKVATEVVAKDKELGQKMGVEGTPTAFVNGRLLTGRLTLESISEALDDEIQRIKARPSGGVASSESTN